MKTIEIDYSPQIQTRNQLLSAATALFLRYGIKSISMDDIAKKMGISKKTIYNIISTKHELVAASITSILKKEQSDVDTISATSKNSIDEMILIARQTINTLNRMKPTFIYDLRKYHPKVWQIIESQHLPYISKVIEENVKRGKKEKYYRKELEPSIIARLYLGLAQAITIESNKTIMQGKLADIYESMIIYHLHGIMNEKGKKEFIKYTKKQNI